MSFDMRVPWRIFSRPTELAESGFAGLKNRGSHILAGVDMKVSEKLAIEQVQVMFYLKI